MFRLSICITFLFSLFCSISLFASEGYIGENPGLNFYGRIDESAAQITKGLIDKRISEHSTFAKFGRYCRPALPWFDSARMEKQILEEVWNQNYSSITALAAKKGVTLSTNSLQNLAVCLQDAYGELQVGAMEQYNSLSTMGSMGLYMDGDTANSDYDIISDITKINSLIFTEELKYTGTKNGGKTSLSNLLSGKIVAPLISSATQKEIDTINGNSATSDPAAPTVPTPETFGSLGIGKCGSESGGLTLPGLADDVFLQELSDAIQGGGSPIISGITYGTGGIQTNTGTAAEKSVTSKGDFFSTPRCEGVFCIKFGIGLGSSNLFGGGKNISIETMLDTHIALNEPKSWQNSGLQRMTSNMMQLPCVGLACDLKNMIKGGGIYLVTKSGKKERVKTEETNAVKDAKLEQALRCGFYSAGIATANLDMMNSVQGAAYIDRKGVTSQTIKNTEAQLGVIEPDAKSLSGCMDTAVENGRSAYYGSFSDDLTEIKTFTEAMIQTIVELLRDGEKIDTLPTV